MRLRTAHAGLVAFFVLNPLVPQRANQFHSGLEVGCKRQDGRPSVVSRPASPPEARVSTSYQEVEIRHCSCAIGPHIL
jgi:hypothetical protein